MTLRAMLGHSGVCDACGCFAHVWVDYDTRTKLPVAGPQLCDDCNTIKVVRDAYADDADFASRIYGARTAEEAIRLLNL